MTESLNAKQARWLTYLVFLLITALSVIAAYELNRVAAFSDALVKMQESLPKEYVRTDQYRCDRTELLAVLRRIDEKLDRHMELSK